MTRNIPLTEWYSQPVTEITRYTLPTPHGILVIEPQYTGEVYGKMEGRVKLHSVEYQAEGKLRFDHYEQRWVGGIYLRRPDNGYSSEAANKKFECVNDLFRLWCRSNPDLIRQGQQQAYQQLLDRAQHRLNAMEASIRQRREWLAKQQQALTDIGELNDSALETLNNLWSWRF